MYTHVYNTKTPNVLYALIIILDKNFKHSKSYKFTSWLKPTLKFYRIRDISCIYRSVAQIKISKCFWIIGKIHVWKKSFRKKFFLEKSIESFKCVLDMPPASNILHNFYSSSLNRILVETYQSTFSIYLPIRITRTWMLLSQRGETSMLTNFLKYYEQAAFQNIT